MEQEGEEKKRVCVTGAGGFIATWLIKRLLSKGYIVHGTVRNPSDAKNAHLKKLENASENLKLFKADLLDPQGLRAAIEGCEGVFHVASPMPGPEATTEEVISTPAITGTQCILRACSEFKVKKLVLMSSGGAIVANPKWPQDKLMDEDSWSDIEFCRATENWYCLAKAITEREALDYGAEHGFDVATLCPSLVFGPMLQSTVNGSSWVLISILTGTVEMLNSNIMKIYVDVRDVADALLLLYENPKASGRYNCAPHAMKLPELADYLKTIYPNYNYAEAEKYTADPYDLKMSSQKLEKLGWNARPLKETLVDSVECYKELGLLDAK